MKISIHKRELARERLSVVLVAVCRRRHRDRYRHKRQLARVALGIPFADTWVLAINFRVGEKTQSNEASLRRASKSDLF